MSRNRDPVPLDCKVWVGDLGSSASKQDLEDAFGHYGPLRNVWVARNPPGFAFVEFEEHRDADDAARALDGRSLCGRKVRVELSTGKSRSRSYNASGRGGGRPGGGRGDMRCYDCGDRGHLARDCPGNGSGGGGRRSSGGSRRRSRSRSRTPRRSRSRSRTPRNKSRSRSRSRERSPRRSSSHTRKDDA